MNVQLPPRTFTPQQGFNYEKITVDFLSPFGHCKDEYAGSSSDKPDLTLINKLGQTSGCELKMQAASAGSLKIVYKNKKWQFNDTGNNPEKEFLKSVAEQLRIFDLIKKQWTNVPLKREPAPSKAEIGKLSKEEIFRIDQSNFKEINGKIDSHFIESYYNKKKTYYVNIGTRGFYLLGPKDPLNFNKNLRSNKINKMIPEFGKNSEAIYRVRLQSKGNSSYQFTFEIMFSIKSSNASPYNIAPLASGGVAIDKNKADISFFL